MEEIKVAIIEDDQVIRESLISSVQMYPAMDLGFAAGSVEEALRHLDDNPQLRPDVVMMDIGLPGMDGISGIPRVKERLDETNIIMLTTYEEQEKIFAALCAGACSYISKRTSLKQIMDAIFTVYRGGSYMSPSIARKVVEHFKPIQAVNSTAKLSDRQLQIVDHLSSGESYKRIAEKLEISIDTVRFHIKKIYKLLEVNSKVDVINLYREGRL